MLHILTYNDSNAGIEEIIRRTEERSDIDKLELDPLNEQLSQAVTLLRCDRDKRPHFINPAILLLSIFVIGGLASHTWRDFCRIGIWSGLANWKRIKNKETIIMKSLFKLFPAMIASLMLIGCDSPSLLAKVDLKSKYAFSFFKFSDPEYQHHIIARLDTTGGKSAIILPSSFPRRDLYDSYYYLENKYLYRNNSECFVRCDTLGLQKEIAKTNLCDMSYRQLLVALEDGYYTWYPFTSIPVVEQSPFLWWENESNGYSMMLMQPVVLSARWEDICSFDMDTVQIISTHPYSEAHGLGGMYQYTHEMSTEELINTINRLIKEKDFAQGGIESIPWFK